MMFTSFSFLILLSPALLLYYSVPKRGFQRGMLVIISYAFCASFFPASLMPLFFVTGIAYCIGRILRGSRVSRCILVIGIVLLLLPLLTIKYSNSSCTLGGYWGISFYTLIAIGYIVDVYRGIVRPEKNIFSFALFIGFFPQIVSGPISRAASMLPQFRLAHRLRDDNISHGLWQMGWGYFMKLVIADRAALLVDTIISNLNHYGGVSILFAIFFYTVQLYCDFAGYSLIAIGCGRLFGFTLPVNFCRPYFSTSIAGFWHRWHISLSTWLRDYVYIPCGGSRGALWQTCLNLLITFLVSGLWHGTTSMFLLWGAYHGLMMILHRLLHKTLDSFWQKIGLGGTWILRLGQMTITTLFVSMGWVIFISSDWNALSVILHSLIVGKSAALPSSALCYFLFAFVILVMKEIVDEFYSQSSFYTWTKKPAVRIIVFAFLVISILAFGVLDGGQFIYGTF